MLVFESNYVTVRARAGAGGEIRYKTIGVLDEVLIVSVIHTDRLGVVRLISARPAKRKERKFYDGQNRKGQA